MTVRTPRVLRTPPARDTSYQAAAADVSQTFRHDNRRFVRLERAPTSVRADDSMPDLTDTRIKKHTDVLNNPGQPPSAGIRRFLNGFAQ